MKCKKMIPLLMVFPLLLTGCWDKVEIDERIFISSIGVDAGPDISKQKEDPDVKSNDPFQQVDFNKLRVTYAYPNISELTPQKGGTAETKQISADSYSMQGAVAKATAMSSRTVSFGHLKLLMLDKGIMSHPDAVKEITDYLQREPSINRMMLVVMCDGKAEEYLKYKPDMEKNVEKYIRGLMKNNEGFGNARITTLNDVLKELSKNGNSLVPIISYDKEKQQLFYFGMGVIKDYKYKGTLTARENTLLQLMKGKSKNNSRVVFADGHPVDYIVDSADRKVKVNMENDKLKFDVAIETEGLIKGYSTGNELLSAEKLQKLQDDFSSSISKECSEVIKITQEDMNVDVIDLRENVQKFHPVIWRKVKDSWSEAFKDAEINVHVDAKIRRTGTVK